MSAKRNAKLLQAIVASAPVMLLTAPRAAQASGTWTGAVSNSWGDAANWVGSPIPPGIDLAAGTADLTDAFIGNNSTAALNGFNITPGSPATINRLHLGYAGPGATNAGDGTLMINSGSLLTQQFNSIGDGASGALIVNGGIMDFHGTDNTKDTIFAYTHDSTIMVSSGTLQTSEYGLEQGAGFGTLLVSGGTLQFGTPGTTRGEAGAHVDFFSFTGGAVMQVRDTTINDISGSGSISFDGNSSAVVRFNIQGNQTWGGIAGPIGAAAGSGAINKNGPGTLTLTSSQNYTTQTVVSGGTLAINYAASPAGMLDDTSTLSIGAGTLRLESSPTQATTELVSRLGASGGGGALILHNNGAGITLDARSSAGTATLAHTVGGAIDISVQGGVLGADSKVLTHSGNNNGILPVWMTVNNFSDWATNDGTDSVVPYTGYTAVDLGTVDPNTDNTATNVLLNSSQTPVPGTTSLTFNSIKLTGSAGIDMSGGGSISLGTAGGTTSFIGGILANSTGSISGGRLTVNGSVASELLIATKSDLTIGSNIVPDGVSGGTLSLTKTGPAVLTLTGNNSYNGLTFIDGGTLKLGSATALPSNAIVNISDTAGAILDLNGNNTTLGALLGGATFNNSNGHEDAPLVAAGAEVKLTNANLTLVNSGSNSYFGGVISGNGNLAVTSGIATLTSAASTYTGTTTISNGGTLAVVKLANGGSPSGIGASSSAASNLVLDGGTLRFVGRVNGSTDRLFTISQNGGTLEAFGGDPTKHHGTFGMIQFTNPGLLGMSGSGSRTLTLTGSAGTFDTSASTVSRLESGLASVIPDAAPGSPTSVALSNTHDIGLQWDLGGLNTYTGTTTINAGTLSVSALKNGGVASGIGASSSDPNNLVINGTGALQYTGAGDSTDRLFSLNGNGFIAAEGTGAINFTNTGTFNAGGTLGLSGSSTANNTFLPQISGGGGFTKAGSGLWIVGSNNSYSGQTTISGGTLSVSNLAGGGANSSIGSAHNGPQDLFIGGGALRYTGPAVTTDRLLTFAGNAILDASGTGPINFNNAGQILSNATGTLTFTLTGTNTGNNTFAPIISDTGTGSITSVSKAGPGMWVLTGANNYTGNTTVAGGTLVLSGVASAPALTGPGSAVINSGNLVIDYTGNTDPTSTVVAGLLANIGNNNTQGQVRTGHTANANRGIGYIDNTGSSQLLLKYAYRGDANLDGKVNALDFNAIATNFGGSNKQWVQGDFNYDGTVNTSDFTYLSQTFGSAPLASDIVAAPVLGSVVPEPASLAMLGLTAAFACGRKRRKIARIAK